MKKLLMKMMIGFLSLLILPNCSNKNRHIKNDAISELKHIAEQIDSDFKKVSNEVYKIAKFTEFLYLEENRKKNLIKVDKNKYETFKNGVFHKPKDDGKSAIFVSGFKEINQDIKNIVYFTEPLDSIFIDVCKRYPEIVQAYYNGENSYNRIYPFFDVITQFEVKMCIPDFSFYYLADRKHNPQRRAVWVKEPYIDPAGRGWMVSAIAPAYVDDSLVGVSGLDVTIKTITNRYILHEESNLMIVEKSGIVVTTNNYLIALFNLPPLINHKYIETIKSDTYKSSNYNLLKNKSEYIRYIAKQIIIDKNKEIIFNNSDDEYLILSEEIPQLEWIIIKVLKL